MHVINLIIQNLIAKFNIKIFDDVVFATLKDIKLKNVKINTNIIQITKKTNSI